MSILLIEDEQKIADFVCDGLKARGFEVEHCADGRIGYERAREPGHEAILLDLMLPGRDGLDILRDLRRQGIQTPVILLTARNELGDRVSGLELGADDYLAKPFYVEELAARLQALLRRLSGERQNTVQAGDVLLDRIARTVHLHGHSIELTTREFTLLEYLMRSPGHVFTRAQILEHVWGYDFDPSTNVVDVCIRRIRGKLSEVDHDGTAATLIEAVRGTGYRFRKDPA
jgi:DNA-binding response OmpR family regulator